MHVEKWKRHRTEGHCVQCDLSEIRCSSAVHSSASIVGVISKEWTLVKLPGESDYIITSTKSDGNPPIWLAAGSLTYSLHVNMSLSNMLNTEYLLVLHLLHVSHCHQCVSRFDLMPYWQLRPMYLCICMSSSYCMMMDQCFTGDLCSPLIHFCYFTQRSKYVRTAFDPSIFTQTGLHFCTLCDEASFPFYTTVIKSAHS